MTSAPVSPATAPPAPPRPSVVVVAFWLQLALVVALILIAITSIIEAIHYDGLIDQAALIHSGNVDDVASERAFNVAGALGVVIPLTVLGVWLGLTLPWVRRGNQVARVLALVGFAAPVVFALLACLVGGLFGFVGLFAFALASGPDGGPFPDEEPTDGGFPDGGYPGWEGSEKFYNTLYNLDTGGWSIAFDAILTTLTVIALLCAVATAVLLCTGPANRFFRPGRHPAPGPRFGFPYPAGPQFTPPYPPQYATPYPPQSAVPYSAQPATSNPPQTAAPYSPQTAVPYPAQPATSNPPQSAAPYPAQPATSYPPQAAAGYPPQSAMPYPPQSTTSHPSQLPAPHPAQPGIPNPEYPTGPSYPTPVPWGPPSVAYGPPAPPVAAFPPVASFPAQAGPDWAANPTPEQGPTPASDQGTAANHDATPEQRAGSNQASTLDPTEPTEPSARPEPTPPTGPAASSTPDQPSSTPPDQPPANPQAN